MKQVIKLKSIFLFLIKLNMGCFGFDAFQFRITSSYLRLELQFNDNVSLVYQDVSIDKWPHENYFKVETI
ncbi:hypothetical protein [Winogradskyella sp. Asnod2-B02-A]|uniref:hypothetical protein n=1 Tax=Winogradskyella sp. Asnod2-B02-A TaxID=3160583 RepID=UPI00386BC0D6